MIFHGDLKSDLQPSFHLKYQSIYYTVCLFFKCMLLPQFANCFSIYRLNKHCKKSTVQPRFRSSDSLWPSALRIRPHMFREPNLACIHAVLFSAVSPVLFLIRTVIKGEPNRGSILSIGNDTHREKHFTGFLFVKYRFWKSRTHDRGFAP